MPSASGAGNLLQRGSAKPVSPTMGLLVLRGGGLVWSSPASAPLRMRCSTRFGSWHASVTVSILLRLMSPMQGTCHCPSDQRWPFAAMSPGAVGSRTDGLQLRGSLEAANCLQCHLPCWHRPHLGHILYVMLGKEKTLAARDPHVSPAAHRHSSTARKVWGGCFGGDGILVGPALHGWKCSKLLQQQIGALTSPCPLRRWSPSSCPPFFRGRKLGSSKTPVN